MDQIKGFISHLTYQNPDNGYTVLELETTEEAVVCVGTLHGIQAGMTICADGEYVEHPVYGRQFKIIRFQEQQPEDADGMERYLASGAISGIGPALAKRIVNHFGEDTFRIMEEEPERLVEIKGISERKAREIATQMEEKKDLRKAFLFLQQYGISNTLAVKIYQQYGNSMYDIMAKNPYKLAEDIDGIGFRIADEIAEKIGIHVDSEFRICSGILYCLLQAGAEGHSYLPKEVLLQRAAGLLGLPNLEIETHIMNMMMDKKLVVKNEKVYSMTSYYTELNCARILLDLNEALQPDLDRIAVERKRIEGTLDRLGDEQGIILDDLQREAVLKSMESGVFLLSGGPGTGKTTTINAMLHCFEAEGMDIFLAAPTGRAAKRMTETTGYEARTIHRMLELNGGIDGNGRSFSFERNEENPLEADVIIIDEMSMVDIYLFYALLKAIAQGTRLIMVGDVDQLPSVGPGQVLRDLMESKTFPQITLTKIFRQEEGSHIVYNAHKINRGEDPVLDNKSKDFFFLERNQIDVIYKHMVQLVRDKLPKYVQAPFTEVQVLTPMRKGPLGAETLNKILQEYLNPPAPAKSEHEVGEGKLRVGDKVMQIRNNYQLEWEVLSRYGIPIDSGMGVFNGDIGMIREIDEYNQYILVEYDEGKKVKYPFSQLEELELAYAITIHKSQGSEYPAVVMPLLGGSQLLLHRNLLYTGVTRAKKSVVILGSKAQLEQMIRNENQRMRYTSLKDYITELAESNNREL